MNEGGEPNRANQPETRRGRPPLPHGRARSVILKTRVKPAAADRFEEIATELGMTVSDAMREALARWCDVYEVNKRIEHTMKKRGTR